jgi:hypothetical protein
MVTLQELAAKMHEEATGETTVAFLAALYELYNGIMALPTSTLREEAAIREGKFSVLHEIVFFGFRLDAIARLVDEGGIDIDGRDSNGATAIMNAAYGGFDDIVRCLASRKADLSIVNDDGYNVYTLAENDPDTSQEKKASVYRALAEHGVTSGEISTGFRSTLNASNLIITPPRRLAQETGNARFYITAMALSNEELALQAKSAATTDLLDILSSQQYHGAALMSL